MRRGFPRHRQHETRLSTRVRRGFEGQRPWSSYRDHSRWIHKCVAVASPWTEPTARAGHGLRRAGRSLFVRLVALARAVVPPPRLRAIPPPFSAPLRHRAARVIGAASGDRGRWAPLRNPARSGALRPRTGHPLGASTIPKFFGCPSGRGYRLPPAAIRAYAADLYRVFM